MAVVGLNMLYLAPAETGGMETYARELVPRLVRAADDGMRFVAFVGTELGDEMREQPWAPGLRAVRVPVSSRTRAARSAAEQTLLAVAIRRAGVELLHSLATTTPMVPGPPTIVTIQDLIYRRFPETHRGVLAAGMAALTRGAVARARRIIAPSEATAADLRSLLAVPRDKIDVVPLGPGTERHVAPTPEAELRARLGLGGAPIVLSPSAKRPHKNLTRLVQAVASLSDVDAVLVVPGYASTYEDDLAAEAERAGAADRVRFTGWVSDADLEGLYAAATCVAFPSLAEGFGLPVLEAMRRGVPVACADATALPEVAGDAALLFDPLSVAQIAGAVRRLLSDAALRGDLAARGREQAARFTWDRTARGTLDAYERVLADGGRF
jgi:glycosyltransferase involved in cell wall biosynthesis